MHIKNNFSPLSQMQPTWFPGQGLSHLWQEEGTAQQQILRYATQRTVPFPDPGATSLNKPPKFQTFKLLRILFSL